MPFDTIKHECGIIAFDMNAGTYCQPRYVYDKDDVDNAIYLKDAAYNQLCDRYLAIQREVVDYSSLWINVKVRLPDTIDDVLVCTPYGVCTGYYMDGRWRSQYGVDVSAWMPKPLPPK